jgi:hypothetical protein
METVRVVDVTAANAGDLCRLCVPPERREDPAFVTGMAEKGKWVAAMLDRWGAVAKLAYWGAVPAGQIQYVPLPDHEAVAITCIYVPAEDHWHRGVATRLLDSLIEDMGRPKPWFGGRPVRVLVTKTFPGEKPGQFSARAFFLGRGFRQVEACPDALFLPLLPGADLVDVTEWPSAEDLLWTSGSSRYVPQPDDAGVALIIYGPSFCPFSFTLLKKAEELVREAAPEILIRWISRSEQPVEVERRGGFAGCVVNATPITSFVLDRQGFQREVRAALEGARPRGTAADIR